jgi:membrane-associated phospholipid phosphatase
MQSPLHQQILDLEKRLRRSTPAEDWFEDFRILPPWWVMVLMVAVMMPMLVLDGVIEEFLKGVAPWVKHDSAFWFVMKQPGEFYIAVVFAIVIGLKHPWKWAGAGMILSASVVTSLITTFLKWIVGRRRPVTEFSAYDLEPFRGGVLAMFDQRNLAFPSGHATQAFTLAMCMTILVPRYWPAWFAIATCCAIQRVAELAHYPGDVFMGLIVGVIGTRFVVWIILVLTGQK